MKTYHTEGVCSTEISFETEDGVLTQVKFEGMRIEDVIEKLKGITCESNPTS